MKIIGSTIISLILVVTVVGGGLLHAIVPHSHGDDHDNGQSHESAEWTDLHGALSHDHKKMLLAIVAAITIVVMATVLHSTNLLRISLAYLRRVSSVARARDPSAGELLRRGIHPYRAFG